MDPRTPKAHETQREEALALYFKLTSTQNGSATGKTILESSSTTTKNTIPRSQSSKSKPRSAVHLRCRNTCLPPPIEQTMNGTTSELYVNRGAEKRKVSFRQKTRGIVLNNGAKEENGIRWRLPNRSEVSSRTVKGKQFQSQLRARSTHVRGLESSDLLFIFVITGACIDVIEFWMEGDEAHEPFIPIV